MLSALNLNLTQKGIIIALFGFVSFAIADACAKWLGAHYPVFHVIFWTYYVSLIFILCISPFLGGLKKTISTKKLPIHIGRGVCAFGISFFIVSALKGENSLPLATLYTILFLAPFLITIIAIPLYKETVPLKSWFIIALGFLGVLVAFRFGMTDFSINTLYAGIALIFIVALSMLARPLDHNESILSLSFYPNIVILSLLGFFVLPDISLPQTSHMPIFLLNGICVTIGLSAIAYGFRIAPFAVIAPIHYIQMVLAILIGYMVFNDVPDIWMIAGGTIIIASGILLIFSKNNIKRNF